MKISLTLVILLVVSSYCIAQSATCQEFTLEQSGFVFCLSGWTAKLSSRDVKPHYFVQRTPDFYRSLVISEFGDKSKSRETAVKMFSTLILETRKGHRLISTSEFTTTSGLVGTKFVTDASEEWNIGREMKSVFYCFEGPRDLKLLFELRYPAADIQAEAEIDKVLKELREPKPSL